MSIGPAVGGQCGGQAAAVGQGADPLHHTRHTAHEQLLRVCQGNNILSQPKSYLAKIFLLPLKRVACLT